MPKSRHQRVPVVQQDVLRLDVAVNDSLPVGVVESARDLGRDPYRIGDRKAAFPGSVSRVGIRLR